MSHGVLSRVAAPGVALGVALGGALGGALGVAGCAAPVQGVRVVVDDAELRAGLKAQALAHVRKAPLAWMSAPRPAVAGKALARPGRRHEAPLRRLREATVVLGVLYQCGSCQEWHLTLGSGVVVSEDGVVLTNLHVVDRPDAGAVVVMTAGGDMRPVTGFVAASKPRDLALVRLAPGPALAALPLGDDPAQGAPVWVMGHPDGRLYTLTRGVVSRTYLSRSKSGAAAPMIEITAAFARGSSGSPVVDRTGALVGVATNTKGIYYDDKAKTNLQLVLRRAVPVSAVRALLPD